MENTFTLNVDGREHTITADPATPLLYVLRDELGKKGPKFGCGLAQCGACTIIHEGVAMRSCVVPVSALKGEIRTLDGLGTEDKPHPLQLAFIAEEAGQCEYCINGWIMTSAALLEENPSPSEDQIKEALEGNLCRCTGYRPIIESVSKAAKMVPG